MLKYTEDHEWLNIDGDIATVGITEHATEQLGDLVFVELPDEGAEFEIGDTAATVESVKAASDVFAPVTGEITEKNEAIEADPAIVNGDPMGDGWFFKIRITDKSELDDMLDEAGYKDLVS